MSTFFSCLRDYDTDDDYLVAINEAGAELWRVNLAAHGGRPWGLYDAVGGVVLRYADEETLLYFDAAGELRWTYSTTPPAYPGVMLSAVGHDDQGRTLLIYGPGGDDWQGIVVVRADGSGGFDTLLALEGDEYYGSRVCYSLDGQGLYYLAEPWEVGFIPFDGSPQWYVELGDEDAYENNGAIQPLPGGGCVFAYSYATSSDPFTYQAHAVIGRLDGSNGTPVESAAWKREFFTTDNRYWEVEGLSLNAGRAFVLHQSRTDELGAPRVTAFALGDGVEVGTMLRGAGAAFDIVADDDAVAVTIGSGTPS